MSTVQKRPASTGMVVVAFAIVYIVWGSTYFFIRLSEKDFPPMLLGALRFVAAGVLMLSWCLVRGERLFVWKNMRPALISGVLLLFFGNGALIWSEQYVASSLAAILLSSGPIWFVLLDRRNWGENLRSKETVIGLLVGFAGVILLFGERLAEVFSSAAPAGNWQVIAMVVLLMGSVCWAAGSL